MPFYGSTWTQAVITRHPEADAAEWASMGIEEAWRRRATSVDLMGVRRVDAAVTDDIAAEAAGGPPVRHLPGGVHVALGAATVLPRGGLPGGAAAAPGVEPIEVVRERAQCGEGCSAREGGPRPIPDSIGGGG